MITIIFPVVKSQISLTFVFSPMNSDLFAESFTVAALKSPFEGKIFRIQLHVKIQT